MKRFSRWSVSASLMLLVLLTGSFPSGALAEEAAEPAAESAKEEDRDVSALHVLLLYLPNRLFDLVDIARLRLRVGPGVAAGVRATDFADLYIGSYASVFAGLPGPRMKRTLPIPAGLETKNGVEISVADGTLEGNFGPGYAPTEFGISAHVILVGADVGLDPIEIVDFLVGFLTFDIRDDDL